MKQARRKRKRKNVSLNSSTSTVPVEKEGEFHEKVSDDLTKIFGILSIEDSLSHSGMVNMGIPKTRDDIDSESMSSSSVSGGDSCFASTSGSSESPSEGVLTVGVVSGNKQNKIVAAAGTVSNFLGKDYIKRVDYSKSKTVRREIQPKDKEVFLYSLLGPDCPLSMDVVQDVLSQCGYDLEKALNFLLESIGTISDGFSSDKFSKDGTTGKNTFSSNESGGVQRNYCNALLQTSLAPNSTQIGSNFPHIVLESLFNLSKCNENNENSTKWSDVAKRMKTMARNTRDLMSANGGTFPPLKHENQREEYHLLREPANKHWDSMKSYYQRASVAHSKGEKETASYLADKGRVEAKLALRGDEKASHDIFFARNQNIENEVTIDMHGQHVKQAMKLLKLHLLFATYVGSIKTLRVITGCGSHGLGKSKLKHAMCEFLKKEGLLWNEENRGTLFIQIDGFKEFSFLEYDADSD